MPNPAFIWPADHAWCVANDVGPHWAGIGADVSAIDEMLADPRLDVVPANPREDQPAYRGNMLDSRTYAGRDHVSVVGDDSPLIPNSGLGPGRLRRNYRTVRLHPLIKHATVWSLGTDSAIRAVRLLRFRLAKFRAS